MEELENLGYLARLMLRLTIGCVNLPEETQKAHGDYVLNLQRADGGWAGREGESDLYYTSFALRVLAMLGLLDGEVADKSSAFIRSRLGGHETIVDLLSLVYSAKLIEAACSKDPLEGIEPSWEGKLAELLNSLRRDDGGFSKSMEGQAGSTYQTFLVLLCLELMDKPCPNQAEAVRFLTDRQQGDGGFLEIRVAKRSGTNPTAAAIGALRILNSITEPIEDEAVGFLLDLQSDEGGFRANARIPVPDLLSTFTACVTLEDLDGLHEINTKAALNYVKSMEQADGGFRGFQFDPAHDIEYTFYGLGCLALLS